jgi:three-Cys-motif partner protein
MKKAKQSFGGDWTNEKLKRLNKYLLAYTTAMKNQRYTTVYIDAFAGTGYRTSPKVEENEDYLFPEMDEFIDGSARLALQVTPEFDKYIFIERDESKFAELHGLKKEFPHLADKILPKNEDANAYLRGLCDGPPWNKHRAVLFLDPFGMQVTWDTIEAIAKTKAIDVWYLFPLMAVTRMLKKKGDIPASWRKRIDTLLGSTGWYDLSYAKTQSHGLFGDEEVIVKVSDFDSIINYVIGRLQTVFPGVASNPLPLLNSRNNPLYLLCFAVSNPNQRAKELALKIAGDVLRK